MRKLHRVVRRGSARLSCAAAPQIDRFRPRLARIAAATHGGTPACGTCANHRTEPSDAGLAALELANGHLLQHSLQ